MSWYNYYVGYICETSDDLIKCQQKYMNEGYLWSDVNGDELMEIDEMSDKVVIYLNKETKRFGWDWYHSAEKQLFEKDYGQVTPLKLFGGRKEKLERILGL